MPLGSAHAANADLDASYGSHHADSWPNTLKLRLYVGNPSAGGSEITTAGGYAPISITNNATNFPSAATRQKKNGVTLTFPTSTGAWSGQPNFAAYTDATGNVLDYGPIPTVVVTKANVIVSFAVGSIVLSA